MCISTSPHPVSAVTAAMAGSDNAVTSLITTAPAATAAAATTAFEVSIETSAPDPASAATTGSTRVISSSASTAEAPGRVLSPPTSIRSAPSAHICKPWATAAS